MLGFSKPTLAIFALIFANIIWGATSPILKWSLEDITPFTLAFLRFFFASLILLPFLKGTKIKIAYRDWPKFFMLVFVGIFIHISFFLLGLEISSSINVPIIASAGPIFLMLCGILFLKEHPGRKKIAGASVGLIGVAIIVLLPLLGPNASIDGSILGNLFFVIATISGVCHTVLLKSISKKYEPITLLFWSFALAAFMFFPMFYNDVLDGVLLSIGMQGLLGITFATIATSVIAYFCFYWGLKYLMASEVGIFTYIDPIVAIVIAAPLLGEYPSSTYIFGSILVFLGIYIAEGRIHYHPIHLFRR